MLLETYLQLYYSYWYEIRYGSWRTRYWCHWLGKCNWILPK